MRLTLLQLGLLQPLGIPVPGYLVQADDGTTVLIDSGFPESFVDDPPGPVGPLALRVEMRDEDRITRRLASLGLAPGDVDLLVCTHLDADHAGNHDLFADAELVVQRSHLELARSGHERFAPVREHWDAPGLRYRPVDGDTTLLAGVELIETSGHVPGHQSVLVRLPEAGPVLLAIDAVPTAGTLDPDARPIFPNDDDEAATRRSTRKLADLVAREGVRLVIHGHDAEQWPTLRKAPEWYV